MKGKFFGSFASGPPLPPVLSVGHHDYRGARRPPLRGDFIGVCVSKSEAKEEEISRDNFPS